MEIQPSYNQRFTRPYSFNDMEYDDEIKGEGNSYDFGARMLDPRLGRWFKPDNKSKLFPSVSTYSYGNNNPIYYVDSDGNVIEPADDKSKNDYNSAIANLLAGNEIAARLFTFVEEKNSISNISDEDLLMALNATESLEQRAMIRTLYLASNSKLTYSIQSLSQGTKSIEVDFADGYKSNISGDKVSIIVSLQEALQDEQIADAARTGDAYSTGRVNEKRKSIVPGEVTKRDGDAMLFAAIGASFMLYDPYINTPNETTFEYRGDIQLSAIQFENIAMNFKGKTPLSGTDFMRPDKSQLTRPATNYVNNIPNQIRYNFLDYTFDTMIIDRLQGTAEISSEKNYNKTDKQDSPK